MRYGLTSTVAAIALAVGMGLAGAASQMNLTESQKQTIEQSLASQAAEDMPSNFTPTVGAKVPESVSLKPLPSVVTGEVSELKDNQFAKMKNNDILIVDPSDREVVAVIQGTSTTGAGPSESGGTSGATSPPSTPK